MFHLYGKNLQYYDYRNLRVVTAAKKQKWFYLYQEFDGFCQTINIFKIKSTIYLQNIKLIIEIKVSEIYIDWKREGVK